MNMIAKTLIAASLTFTAAFATANTAVNQSTLSKVGTVKQALVAKDDTKVEVKGYVVKAIGDEKYQFRDSTGTITVDIDDDLWNGKAVSAKTSVTLIGEVDIDHKPAKRVEIDVDQVRY